MYFLKTIGLLSFFLLTFVPSHRHLCKPTETNRFIGSIHYMNTIKQPHISLFVSHFLNGHTQAAKKCG